MVYMLTSTFLTSSIYYGDNRRIQKNDDKDSGTVSVYGSHMVPVAVQRYGPYKYGVLVSTWPSHMC